MRALALFAVVACRSTPAMPDARAAAWTTGPMLPTPRLEPGVTALGQRLVVAGGFVSNAVNGSMVTASVDVFDPNMGPSGAWAQPSPFPDVPVLRHHVQLAAIGTTLYFLGGLDAMPSGTFYPARGDSYVLDTLATPPAWQPLPTIPAGYERGSAGVIVVPPRVYLIGGAATMTALADVIYYDTTAQTWCTNASPPPCQTFPDLPVALSHPAVMRRTDGAFIVAGGLAGLFADSAVDTVYRLDVGATSWIEPPSSNMPPHGAGLSSARGGCAYGVIAGHLVCAGGEGGQAAFELVQRYDPVDNCWITDGDAMPAPRAGTQGAAIGQRLFVPGGSATLPPVYDPVDTLFVYAPPDTPPCS